MKSDPNMSSSEESVYGETNSLQLGDSELTDEEKDGLCKAFALLDTDGDGLIDPKDIPQLLISWGRLPMDEELEKIMSYCQRTDTDVVTGLDFEGFQSYVKEQLADTTDEDRLREAFEAFDSVPPTGKLNVKELRENLKKKGLKLTDDEIDFLYREEDYWMLEEKDIFEYEHLINKILDKPTCDSQFLNC